MTHIDLTTADYTRYVERGRRLRAQAFRDGAAALARAIRDLTRSALGHRASHRLGCADCGAHA